MQTTWPGFQLMGVAIDPKSDIKKPTVFLAGSVGTLLLVLCLTRLPELHELAYEDPLGYSFYGLAVIKGSMDEGLRINFNYMQDMLNPSSLINVRSSYTSDRLLHPSQPFSQVSCYDIYTSSFKPRIFPSAINNFFVVAFPGRCSLVLRISYDPALPLNSSTCALTPLESLHLNLLLD